MNFRLYLRTALIAGICMMAVTAVQPVVSLAAPPEPGVKVQINDKLLEFPDAQPFIDEQHRLLVPVRIVSEQLGYELEWQMEDDQIRLTLTNDEQTITMRTGTTAAEVNGNAAELETAPLYLNERAYVPLRFLSDVSGVRVQWDDVNKIAILNVDGQYHAPAWYAPQYEEPEIFTAYAYTIDSPNARDAMGNELKLGTVAVDPKVIPLGSQLYIEGYDYDGLPAGGMFVTATDTGGAIKGNKLDIFIPEPKDKVRKFGIQQIKVYRIK